MAEAEDSIKEKISKVKNEMKNLDKSFEESILSDEEYNTKKDELEEKLDKLEEDYPEEVVEEVSEEDKKPDRILLYSVLFIIALVILFFVFFKFFKAEPPKTIDELMVLNLEGKLKPEDGYMYKEVYSFVKSSGLWYTQLQTPSGKKLFSIPFRFGPLEVENVTVEGDYNHTLFNDSKNVFVTFDPNQDSLQYIALAIGDLDQSLLQSFNKIPLAACTTNDSDACKGRFVVTCENTDKAVFFVTQANETKVVMKDNCITLQGKDVEVVRATDRLLLMFYNIVVQ